MSAADVPVYALVTAALVAAAIAASYTSLRRAASVDPAVTLRAP